VYLDGVVLCTHLHLLTNHFRTSTNWTCHRSFPEPKIKHIPLELRALQISFCCRVPVALGHELVRLKFVAVHMGQPRLDVTGSLHLDMAAALIPRAVLITDYRGPML